MILPPLTEDDAFGSNPALGSIQYRMPPLSKIYGVPDSYLDHYDKMTFDLSVMIPQNQLNDVTRMFEDKCVT